jgi:hypothetical protein
MSQMTRAEEEAADAAWVRPAHWLDDMSCVPVPGNLLRFSDIRSKARQHIAYGWSQRMDGDWSEDQKAAYIDEWTKTGGLD